MTTRHKGVESHRARDWRCLPLAQALCVIGAVAVVASCGSSGTHQLSSSVRVQAITRTVPEGGVVHYRITVPNGARACLAFLNNDLSAANAMIIQTIFGKTVGGGLDIPPGEPKDFQHRLPLNAPTGRWQVGASCHWHGKFIRGTASFRVVRR